MSAHWIVKVVIVILSAASVWCWTIIFFKLGMLRRLRGRAAKFEDSFWSGGSLDDLYDQIGQRPLDPMAAVFSAAMREWRRSLSGRRAGSPMTGSVQDRIDRVMHVTVGREMERLESHLNFPGLGRLDGALHRVVRHRLGHHEQLPVDRRVQADDAGRRRARHRRGLFATALGWWPRFPR